MTNFWLLTNTGYDNDDGIHQNSFFLTCPGDEMQNTMISIVKDEEWSDIAKHLMIGNWKSDKEFQHKDSCIAYRAISCRKEATTGVYLLNSQFASFSLGSFWTLPRSMSFFLLFWDLHDSPNQKFTFKEIFEASVHEGLQETLNIARED
jgi:hypothetical protein